MRQAREVLFIDGVRTPFGKAGPKGQFWRTRADDMGVKAVRELLRRNPEIPPERIGDVVLAATAQVGDQGLTLGRDVALLAGIPHSVPGFAIDRMCAGALTAVTAAAGEIALGAIDVALAVFTDDGWKVAERDEFLRPDTSLEGLAQLKPAFRAGGRVTAGNSAGLTDGATASFLAAEDTVAELGLAPKLRLVGFAYAGV